MPQPAESRALESRSFVSEQENIVNDKLTKAIFPKIQNISGTAKMADITRKKLNTIL